MTPIKNALLALVIAFGLTPTVNSDAKYFNSSPQMEKPKVLTPIGKIELASLLKTAYRNVFNKEPNESQIAMAWAQVAAENAHGEIIWNNNIGNIGPGLTHEWYAHSHLTSYRSFNTPIEGAEAYWRVINKCYIAMKSFKTSNPKEASIALKNCNYYGADVDHYTKMITSLFWYAKRKIVPKIKEQELSKREKEEREIRTRFTPSCGCSTWW